MGSASAVLGPGWSIGGMGMRSVGLGGMPKAFGQRSSPKIGPPLRGSIVGLRGGSPGKEREGEDMQKNLRLG